MNRMSRRQGLKGGEVDNGTASDTRGHASCDRGALPSAPTVPRPFDADKHKHGHSPQQKRHPTSNAHIQPQRQQQQAASRNVAYIGATVSCGTGSTASGRPRRLQAAAACLRMRGHLAPPDPYDVDPAQQLEQLSAAVSNAAAAGVLPDASARDGTTLGPYDDDGEREQQSKRRRPQMCVAKCRQLPTQSVAVVGEGFQPVPPRFVRELSCSLRGFRADEGTCSVMQSGGGNVDESAVTSRDRSAGRQHTEGAVTGGTDEHDGNAKAATDTAAHASIGTGVERRTAADVPRAVRGKQRAQRWRKRTDAHRTFDVSPAAEATKAEPSGDGRSPALVAAEKCTGGPNFTSAEGAATACMHGGISEAPTAGVAPLPPSTGSRSELLRRALGLPPLQAAGAPPGAAPVAAIVKPLHSVAPPRAAVQQRLKAHSDAAAAAAAAPRGSAGAASTLALPQLRRMVPAEVPSGTVATGARHCSAIGGAAAPEGDWTAEQLACLERAYHGAVAPNTPNFWQLVAARVPGKTARECNAKVFQSMAPKASTHGPDLPMVRPPPVTTAGGNAATAAQKKRWLREMRWAVQASQASTQERALEIEEQMKAQKRTDLWIDRLHKRIPHLRQLPLNLLEVPEPAKRTLDTWTSPPAVAMDVENALSKLARAKEEFEDDSEVEYYFTDGSSWED